MNYLYWYLGVGVAVFAIVFSTHRRAKKDESASIRDLLDAANPNRKKLSYRILHNIVVPALATVVALFGWPVVIYMKGKEIISKKRESVVEKERGFAVERDHLQERLTVPQIEASEVVIDPLAAVPDRPFGHLNAAWETFISSVRADDEIWSFTAPWTTTWGREVLMVGYVVVRGGNLGSHFLTMKKENEKPIAPFSNIWNVRQNGTGRTKTSF